MESIFLWDITQNIEDKILKIIYDEFKNIDDNQQKDKLAEKIVDMLHKEGLLPVKI